jgi:hypothetical protein
METFVLILRALFMTIGTVLAAIYFLSCLWQRVPQLKFQLKAYDWIAFILMSLIFGIGLNQYWGLLAFLPLLLWKVFTHFRFQKNNVRGKGRWMEVQWNRTTPRGFDLPKQMQSELARLPGNAHILLPRLAFVFALTQGMKVLKKNASKSMNAMQAMPANMRGRENEAFDMLAKTENNMKRLEPGKTEALTLPFGMLKVTRL